eukprot:6187152-Pleurochrysis_carterae.AAC.2
MPLTGAVRRRPQPAHQPERPNLDRRGPPNTPRARRGLDAAASRAIRRPASSRRAGPPYPGGSRPAAPRCSLRGERQRASKKMVSSI